MGKDSISSMVASLVNHRGHAHDFALQNFATLLSHSLRSVTSGIQKRSKVSKSDIHLSLKAIALLALNLKDRGNVHEVFKESLPVLSRALAHFEASDPETVLAILECLALVGFFGCADPEETQTAMLIIWDSLIVNNCSSSSSVQAAAVLAWSFLLSSMQGCHVSNKYWKSVISYFSDLLDNTDEDDESTHAIILAVADALALIFETGISNKFLSGEEDIGWKKIIKDNISEKLWFLSVEGTKEKHGNKKKKKQAHWGILKYFDNQDEDGKTIKIAQKVKDGLVLSKVSQIIQMEFIKGFLGLEGFANHLQENENLNEIFKFRQSRGAQKDDDNEDLSMPEREEVTVRFYQQRIGKQKEHSFDILPFLSEKEKQVQKRATKSPHSSLSKARSQLLKKQLQAKAASSNDY